MVTTGQDAEQNSTALLPPAAAALLLLLPLHQQLSCCHSHLVNTEIPIVVVPVSGHVTLCCA
jgi:hypothetical protein